MKSVMVDNWFLHNILAETCALDNGISQEYSKLLSAIILWDEVYYPQNVKTPIYTSELQNSFLSYLQPIDDSNFGFEEEAERIYNENFKDKETNIVAGGAIRYLLLSNSIGLDYFPSNNRSDFLKRTNPYNIMNKLNRLDLYGLLDKSINDYFYELNSRFGSTIFEIKHPVLVDFIVQNCPSNMSYIEYALHLREEGPVGRYKKYLSDIEKALKNSDWLELNDIVKSSEDIVSKIVSMDRKRVSSVDITLAPAPSLSFSKNLCFWKNRIQLSFLVDLTKFAFNGRIYN